MTLQSYIYYKYSPFLLSFILERVFQTAFVVHEKTDELIRLCINRFVGTLRLQYWDMKSTVNFLQTVPQSEMIRRYFSVDAHHGKWIYPFRASFSCV